MKTFFPRVLRKLNQIFPLLLFCTLIAGFVPRAAAIQASSVGGGSLGVHFDTTAYDASAIDVSNYTVFAEGVGTISVTNATLLADGQTVALQLNGNAGKFFAVGVSNVMEDDGTVVYATITGFTSNLTGTNIGTVGDPYPIGQVFSGLPDTFFVTAYGSGIGGTNDHCEFVGEQVTNNFDMAVLVTNLVVVAPGTAACLMARDSFAADSPSVEICAEPGTNELVMLARTNLSGSAIAFAPPVANTSLGWLRMTCTNNLYTVYYGTNGVNWTSCGSISVPMNSPYIGMAVVSGNNDPSTSAGLTGFGVDAPMAGNIPPVLSCSLYQKTNLVVSWPQPPVGAYAVQVCTNLALASASPATWRFLVLPVFDITITNTNAAMPTPGFYMTIPMDLFSGNQLFVRLSQVNELIPDPVNVTPGVLFSLADQDLVAPYNSNSAETLCDTSVIESSVVTQNGTYVICPPGHTYTFTTAQSASSLETALQVRSLPFLTTTCGDYPTAYDTKAELTFSVPAGSTSIYYTFIAAATTATTQTSPVIVEVDIVN